MNMFFFFIIFCNDSLWHFHRTIDLELSTCIRSPVVSSSSFSSSLLHLPKVQICILFLYCSRIHIRHQIRTHLSLACCLSFQGSPPPPRMIVITRSRGLVMSTWLSLSLMSPVNIRHTLLMFKVCAPLTMTEIEVSILWTPYYTYLIYLSDFMFKACPPLTAHSWQSCKACWTLPPSLPGRSRHFHPAIFSNIFKYWNIFMQIFNQNYVVCLSPCHKVWRPNAAFLQLQ